MKLDAIPLPYSEDGAANVDDAMRVAEQHAQYASLELNALGADVALAHAHATCSLAWSSLAWNKSPRGGAL